MVNRFIDNRSDLHVIQFTLTGKSDKPPGAYLRIYCVFVSSFLKVPRLLFKIEAILSGRKKKRPLRTRKIKNEFLGGGLFERKAYCKDWHFLQRLTEKTTEFS